MSVATPIGAPQLSDGETRLETGRKIRLQPIRRAVVHLLIGAILLMILTFVMVQLIPGDPVAGALGPTASPALIAARRAAYHLNDPLWTQFYYYVRSILTLHLGTSIISGQSVSSIIGPRLVHTGELALLAMVLVLGVGIPLGVFAGWVTRGGYRRKSEGLFSITMGLATSIPDFVMGTFLVVVFALGLHLLPAAGNDGPQSIILPAVALATAPGSFLARVVRLETVKALDQDYILTARSKYLPGRVVFLKHLLPNVVSSALTISGLIFGSLLGGDVIVENVFAWPGIGTEIVPAIISKDYPIVQACILLLGLIILAVNMLIDVTITMLNPKLTTVNTE